MSLRGMHGAVIRTHMHGRYACLSLYTQLVDSNRYTQRTFVCSCVPCSEGTTYIAAQAAKPVTSHGVLPVILE